MKALKTISVILMLLSAAVRVYAYADGGYDAFFAVTQVALPLLSNLLFVLFVCLDKPKLTVIPVFFGIAFFIFKAFTFDSALHTVLCVTLYLAVLTLYFLTVFGVIKSVLPLFLVFFLPFAEHLVSDIAELCGGASTLSYIPELSVLLIMASLAFYALTQKTLDKRE